MTVISDRYQLGEVIGTGGMSDVFAAEDILLGRGVAVKMLRIDMARDVNFRERFRREAQNSGKLSHPAIVAVYDTGETEVNGVNVPYIVMERVFGRTLRDIVNADGPMNPADAARILVPVCDALQVSHDAGIIHRDIKPANVMITNTGAVKVMDFGIARALGDTTSAMTQTAAVIGTAQYLSPEQARGKSVDARSDVYALGCVLYELVTGKPPFEGETPFAVAYQHVQEDPEAPSRSIPDLTPTAAINVDAVILTAMAKHPADRYHTAAEMAEDLELLSRNAVTKAARMHVATEEPQAVREPQPTRVAPTPTPQHRPYRPPQKRKKKSVWPRILVAILAAAVLGIGSAFAYDFFSNRHNDSSVAEMISVPDVVGKQRAEAVDKLESLGLRVDINEEPSPEIARGEVIRTNPAPGSQLQKGTTITVTISSGKEITDVPDLHGMDLDQATQTLADAGLTLSPDVGEEASDSVQQGMVSRQDPAAGAQLSKGSEIRVILSSGPEMVQVPDLTGVSVSQAESTLNSLGLKPQINQIDSTEEADRVLNVQQVGQSVPRGTQIVVEVSNGQLIQMPDLGGMTQNQALQALRQAGWTGSDSQLVAGQPVKTPIITERGKIAQQSPQVGQKLRKDQKVTVRYLEFDITAIAP